jgi:2-keto-4-pentenoate hydratase/2-oxohepta-3-ene-1,7-dioic acid hydratase in catechol pathway
MKLVSFTDGSRLGYGVVSGAGVVDLSRHLGDRFPTINALLDGGLVEAEKLSGAATDHDLDTLAFAPVVPRPDKIVCAAVNYDDHRIEAGRDRTPNPVVFLRLAEGLVGHRQPILVPPESHHLDYEGEIAVVIGKGGRRIAESDAMEHIAGWSIFNDGSIRDWQRHTSQFTAGKNWNDTGGFGPWIVTRDEIADYRTMTLVTRLNGVELQRTSADLMIFTPAQLIAYVSTFTHLRPGDVIATGTCGGVGFKRTPPIFMEPGGSCEIDVGGIGMLVNPIAAESG